MNRGKRWSAGYTIVETMIFLAVSAAMFLSAVALISGRQAHTEFDNSIREFESSMQDIANDVSDGYYANIDGGGQRIKCQVVGNSIKLSSQSGDSQGANQDCIFIGKSVQFAPAGSARGRYSTISLVGKRLAGGVSGGDVQDYSEATVTPIAPTGVGSSTPDATESTLLSGGVTVECVFYGTAPLNPPLDKPCTNTPNNPVQIDTVTFMTTFHAQTMVSGQQQSSGSSHVDLVVPTATAQPLDRSLSAAAADIAGYSDPTKTVKDPAGGVYICLQSNGTTQYALVSLGGQNSRFTTDMSVQNGTCR